MNDRGRPWGRFPGESIMRCNECRDKFSEYLDARLSPDAAEQVERHLASCARCARELEDLRAVLTTVRSMSCAFSGRQ